MTPEDALFSGFQEGSHGNSNGCQGYRTKIKAQEEAGSRPGSDGLELAEGCAAGAEG